MRRRVALAAILFLAAGRPASADESRAIDAARSKAVFSVAHLYVQRVTGSVPIVGGSVTLAAGALVPSAVEATLDPRKIKTGDDDRDTDIQGAEWFDTPHFPLWTFTGTQIARTANGGFTIAGRLTVHGVAAPMMLEATVTGTTAHPVYHALGHVDRHAFGMTVTRTDALVGNELTVTLDVVLK